ncbi:unnamed protein product [Albugo candida]|uniref:Uncharacterized protein n=1 Tax=Albugo candida TaxID=65357 RepID=A0A024G7N6_9STRA|nr:unnamed protein product [Albugo candida]|eukprot:CCI42326.1 unnamed protein product [Albugo candida]
MRWLHSLDISFREIQNPIYIDEHEREDVVAYHQTFLKQMRKYEERLQVVEGLDGSDENVRVSWPVEELRPLILVTHDESPFAFHDGLKRLWLPAGEQPLRKRGQGRSIHVSEFLSDVGGRLELDDEKKLQYPNLPAEACVLVHQGAQHDDWWKAEDLLKQVKERAIPISKAQSPGKQALFAFDYATRHCAVAPEANFRT